MEALQEISFDSAVQSLKEKAAEFGNTYRQFISVQSIAAKDPALYSEWQSVKTKADAVMSSVSWVTKQIDAASSWLGNVFGLNGVNGIGAIPLIPVATITAAIAALALVGNSMLSTLAKTYELKRKLDLIQAGQAGTDILDDSSGTFGGQVGSAVKYLLIGAALYFVVPKIWERMKK